MYVGVRAGGGIGDEIEDPAGDEYELYRVVFDITFFFFVIVILLAIIQGKNFNSSSFPTAKVNNFFLLQVRKCFVHRKTLLKYTVLPKICGCLTITTICDFFLCLFFLKVPSNFFF